MLGLGQRTISVRYWATGGLNEKVRSEQNMKVGNVAKCLSWETASGLVFDWRNSSKAKCLDLREQREKKIMSTR